MAHQIDPDIRLIERFLFDEAQMLDDRRFNEWLSLFSDNGWYWVPITADQDNPFDTVSIIYDDRKLLETRVRRLNNVNIHAESPPPRTSRIIGNVILENVDQAAGNCDISSRFQLVEFRGDKQRLFAGSMRHVLRPEDVGFVIQGKRINLVNSDGMLEGITTLL
jgi:3-phenylpropionate/cinnamic acid dioxygenase small subunit